MYSYSLFKLWDKHLGKIPFISVFFFSFPSQKLRAEKLPFTPTAAETSITSRTNAVTRSCQCCSPWRPCWVTPSSAASSPSRARGRRWASLNMKTETRTMKMKKRSDFKRKTIRKLYILNESGIPSSPIKVFLSLFPQQDSHWCSCWCVFVLFCNISNKICLRARSSCPISQSDLSDLTLLFFGENLHIFFSSH